MKKLSLPHGLGLLALSGLFMASFTAAEAAPYKMHANHPANSFLSDVVVNDVVDRVFFLSRTDVTVGYRLFASPFEGAPETGLTEELSDGDDVLDYAVAPTSVPVNVRVVYRADLTAGAVIKAVDVDGTDRTSLTGIFPLGAVGVNAYEITPNSANVIYIADQNTAGQRDIYRASITSGGGTRIGSVQPNANGNVTQFKITPDSSTVVYEADRVVDSGFALYSTPFNADTGVDPTLISHAAAAGREIDDFEISPDGTTVVFTSDTFTDGKYELFSVGVDGTGLIQLSSALPASGDVSDFAITPDSQFVVYRADVDTDNTFELYRVPIAGNVVPVKVHADFVGGGQGISRYKLTADGSNVVFTADSGALGYTTLFSSSVYGAGGSMTQLSTGIVSSVSIYDFALSPDSASVAFIGQIASNMDPYEIFITPVIGGATVKIADFVGGATVENVAFTADNQSVYFIADPGALAVTSLSIASVKGGGFTDISGPLVSGGQVTFSAPSLSSPRIFFIADKEIDTAQELYGAALPGKVLGDFNADGFADLLISKPGKNYGFVGLRKNGGSVVPTGAPGTDVAVPQLSPLPRKSLFVGANDADANGIADILTYSNKAAYVTYLDAGLVELNKLKVTPPAGFKPVALAPILPGDALPDMLFQKGPRLLVSENMGAGFSSQFIALNGKITGRILGATSARIIQAKGTKIVCNLISGTNLTLETVTRGMPKKFKANAVVDFEGDTFTDIVVTTRGTRVGILPLNDFSTSNTTPPPLATTNAPRTKVVAPR